VNIYNYLRISDRLSTSGQPRVEDFKAIADDGFRTVINLALPTSEHALPDEGAVVTGLGLNYVHIPVVWEAPRVDQFRTFARLMRQQEEEKTWVHCIANMRVSCFFYLYHTEFRGMAEDEARALMLRIWDPDRFPQWKQFIIDVRSQRNDT
jgi:protein tyrosine phosphatase (PTP) superfamily phosphohydrolase (DUF442 family)